MKQATGHGQQNPGEPIRRGDHFFATDRIKQMSEHERTEEITKCKWKQVSSDAAFGHAVKPHQDQRVSKEDRVVKKRLGCHQNETKERTMSMFVCDRVPNFSPRRVRSRMNPRWRQIIARRNADLTLDSIDDRFRLVISAVNHQPARALRNPAAEEDHDQAKRRADSKGKPPP